MLLFLYPEQQHLPESVQSVYHKLKDDEISITLWPDNSSGNESVHEELVNSDSYKKFFGWGDSGERTFKVEELTNKKMRLDYEGTKYVFRKY